MLALLVFSSIFTLTEAAPLYLTSGSVKPQSFFVKSALSVDLTRKASFPHASMRNVSLPFVQTKEFNVFLKDIVPPIAVIVT